MNFPAKEQRKNQQNGEREGQTDQPGGEREHRLVVVQLERRAEIAAQRGGKETSIVAVKKTNSALDGGSATDFR